MERPVVVIGPSATSVHGDLHLGRIACRYIAADMHARYLPASGRRVLYLTGTDDSVLDFTTRLHSAGKLRLRLVEGQCRVCATGQTVRLCDVPMLSSTVS